MIYIGEFKEFNPGYDFPSITESFSDKPYPGKEKIVSYLKNGEPGILSTEIPHDILTGDVIPLENLAMDDGVFAWPLILAYYVDRYNVRLPEEFEQHVLKDPTALTKKKIVNRLKDKGCL